MSSITNAGISLSSSSSTSHLSSSSQLRPDGGWGWIVVFSSLMISFLTDGFLYSSSVFYEKFLRIYDDSEIITSIYFSIMSGMVMLVGPLASGLSQVYGCRIVSILGALITVVGMLLSTVFDSNMYCHALTLGIICGFGLGLMYLPQVIIITEWFDKRLAFATGMAVCGTGFGIATFACISDNLIEYFDWKGAMIVLALLMSLNILFSFTFCYPKMDNPSPTVNNVIDEKNIKEKSSPCSIESKDSLAHNQWKLLKMALKETVNFSVIKNQVFAYFLLANFVANMVYYVPVMITSDYVVRLGLGTSSDGAFLMCLFGLANGFARPICGFISDRPGIDRVSLYGLSLLALSIIVALINLMRSHMLNLQIIYVAFGITEGFYSCLYSVVLVDLFSYDTTIYNSLGIILLFDGIAAMIGPPLTNILVSYGYGYQASIWLCSSMTFISALMLLSTEKFKKIINKKRLVQESSINVIHTC